MTERFVGTKDEFDDGRRIIVDVDGTEIGVLRHEGAFFAFENRCAHQGGPVCEGVLLGQVEEMLDGEGRSTGSRFSQTDIHLICPWHGWEYRLATGEAVTNPQWRIRRFDVVEHGEDVYVAV